MFVLLLKGEINKQTTLKMKKSILLIVCCIAASSYSTLHARNREPYKPKQEITVRYGVVDDFLNNDFWSDWWKWSFYEVSPLERYNNGKYYYDDKIYTQAISLSYTREIKRWLALSVSVAYSGVSQKERKREDNKVISEYKKHRLGIVPMVRFTYFNRPVIRLYSAVGLGFGIKNESWSNTKRDNINTTRLCGQATFFGVSVGKKIFATTEIGTGEMGILTIGGGYRF